MLELVGQDVSGLLEHHHFKTCPTNLSKPHAKVILLINIHTSIL
jgi:hypothetical protein